jgi:cell division protein FtsI/penicillin-binding protein 2
MNTILYLHWFSDAHTHTQTHTNVLVRHLSSERDFSILTQRNIFKQYDALKNEPIVDRNLLKLVQEGMRKVINEPGGTAYGKRILAPGFEMAGKTGTSQVISKREKEMTKAESENNANHAIFIGYAPVHDPKYAISVVVEHGKSGSMAAAPIAKDVLMEVQGLNKTFAINKTS